MIIEDVIARQILDSRGNPTLEVDVVLSDTVIGRAAVPSGASKGVYEALELRDGDLSNYFAQGVQKAVDNVNNIIAPELIGEDPTRQYFIDNLMIDIDGTPNKSNLGANAILGVSLAVAKAASIALNVPLYSYLGGIRANTLPVPMMNIINGGVHADNMIDFQEFMIVPIGAANFNDAVKIGAEVFHSLKRILKKRGYSTSVGDEGGFAPDFASNTDAIVAILDAIDRAGYTTDDVKIAIDAAASEFYQNGLYNLKSEGKTLSNIQMVEFFSELIDNYPIISIEDALAEDDWGGWKILTDKLAHKCQIVGDDLFVTNKKRLKEGIDKGIANSILIKPNQIGTLSETLDTILMAQKAGYSTIISHRSGETEDTFIADLAVAVNSSQIKTGSISRSERVAKYNQLIRIEQNIGFGAKFAGKNAFKKRRYPI